MGEIFGVGSALSHLPVRLGAISIEAEMFNIDPAGWRMLTYNIREVAGLSLEVMFHSSARYRPSAIAAEIFGVGSAV